MFYCICIREQAGHARVHATLEASETELETFRGEFRKMKQRCNWVTTDHLAIQGAPFALSDNMFYPALSIPSVQLATSQVQKPPLQPESPDNHHHPESGTFGDSNQEPESSSL